MSKRMQLNLALGAIAIGLGVAVYFAQQEEEKGPPLTPLASEAVTRIALEHPDAPTIRLAKQGTQWSLVEPVQVEAEQVEINGILALATAETKLTLDAAGVQPAELGLEPPQYSVTLDDQRIEIGGVEPINYRRYVRAGGRIMLIDDPPSAALDKDYADLVSKAPIPTGAEIQKIVLPALTIARAEDGQGWSLLPDVPDAGSDRRQKLVDGWKNARAMWMGLETGTPKGDTVVVTLKDRGEIRFVVAEREPQLVLSRPDIKVRYTLSRALADELLQLPPAPPPAAAATEGAPADAAEAAAEDAAAEPK